MEQFTSNLNEMPEVFKGYSTCVNERSLQNPLKSEQVRLHVSSMLELHYVKNTF